LSESTVRTLSVSSNEPEWMLQKRVEALKHFSSLSMPSFRYGIGIFVDASGLDVNDIDPLDGLDDWVVICPDEVTALPFGVALKKQPYSNLIRKYFMRKIVDPKENKFTALHAAFFNNGLFIRIPEFTELKDPIKISVDMKAHNRIDHVLVIAEVGSKATIIDASGSKVKNGQRFRSQVVEVFAKDNAKVKYVTVQNLNDSVFNFSKRRGSAGVNASIDWIECHLGGRFTQAETLTFLEGDGSRSNSKGVIFGGNDQCFDICNETKHLASRSVSDMSTRAVLDGKSKVVYRGLIRINPGVVNCSGYQKDETILLSENARVGAVPNLEIENNDVRCSHGATISTVDPDKLFYMTSRGLSEKMAKDAIVEGFFDSTLVEIESEDLKGEIKEAISERLRE